MARPVHLAIVTAALLVAAAQALYADAALPAVERGHVVVLPQGQAVTVEGLIDKQGKPHGEATTVTLKWDNKGLEIAFDCTDSAIATGTAKERDSTKTWKDDSVGVLLDIGHTHDAKKHPIALMLSVAGGLFDRRGNDNSYTCDGITSQVTMTDTGYRAVIRAPWQGLWNHPKVGDVWGINLTRIDHEGAAYKNMKHLSWTRFADHPEHIDRWGHIVFAPAGANDKHPSVEKAVAGIKLAHVNRMAALAPHDGSTITLPKGKAVAVDHFTTAAGETVDAKTSASLSWNDKSLVVAFTCADAALTTAHTERDDVKLWKDDCATLWLDLGHSHNTQGKLVMLQIGASGAVLDAKDNDVKWNGEGLVSSAGRTDDGWVGRIEVPWAALGVDPPKPGEVWGANLTRIDQPGEYKPTETVYLSWAPVRGGFVDLDRWGHIIFADTDGSGADEGASAVTAAHAERFKAIAGE